MRKRLVTKAAMALAIAGLAAPVGVSAAATPAAAFVLHYDCVLNNDGFNYWVRCDDANAHITFWPHLVCRDGANDQWDAYGTGGSGGPGSGPWYSGSANCGPAILGGFPVDAHFHVTSP